MKKKDQGGAKTSKQFSDPVLLIDTTEQLIVLADYFDEKKTKKIRCRSLH